MFFTMIVYCLSPGPTFYRGEAVPLSSLKIFLASCSKCFPILASWMPWMFSFGGGQFCARLVDLIEPFLSFSLRYVMTSQPFCLCVFSCQPDPMQFLHRSCKIQAALYIPFYGSACFLFHKTCPYCATLYPYDFDKRHIQQKLAVWIPDALYGHSEGTQKLWMFRGCQFCKLQDILTTSATKLFMAQISNCRLNT